MKSLQNTLAGVFSSHALTVSGTADSTSRRCDRAKGPRRREVEADHRAQLARAFSYRAQHADAAELEALEREWQRMEARGPDFTHHRGRSRFGDAPRHGLDDNAIVRLRYRFNGMARASYEQRSERKHRGLISRTCKDVFNALLWLAERYDRLFPSLLRLAHLAQCSKQSVVTALRVLEELGFLTRHRRLKKVAGVLGPRTEQATNGYEIHEPRTGRGALAWLLFMKPKPESKNQAATVTVVLSYLEQHPETWSSPGIARCDAHGEPPKAARF